MKSLSWLLSRDILWLNCILIKTHLRIPNFCVLTCSFVPTLVYAVYTHKVPLTWPSPLSCTYTLFFILISPHVFFFCPIKPQKSLKISENCAHIGLCGLEGSEGQLYSRDYTRKTQSVLFIGICLHLCAYTVCFFKFYFRLKIYIYIIYL